MLDKEPVLVGLVDAAPPADPLDVGRRHQEDVELLSVRREILGNTFLKQLSWFWVWIKNHLNFSLKRFDV